jgi:hypothetical protein
MAALRHTTRRERPETSVERLTYLKSHLRWRNSHGLKRRRQIRWETVCSKGRVITSMPSWVVCISSQMHRMPLRQRTEAAHTVIVEAEEIVEVGAIPPEQVHLPGLYVNRLFKGSKYEHKIEILKFAHEDSAKKIPETSKRPRIHVN